MARARARMAGAELVIAVFDGARPLTADDRALAVEAAARPSVAMINKTDEPLAIDIGYIHNLFQHIVYAAALRGEGADKLEAAILSLTGVGDLDTADRPAMATERQRDSAARCLDAVRDAAAALADSLTLDAVGVGIDGALAALMELTGERVTEAVVDEVFARFCVGK